MGFDTFSFRKHRSGNIKYLTRFTILYYPVMPTIYSLCD